MLEKKILLVETDDFYVEIIGNFVKLFIQEELEVCNNPAEAKKRVLETGANLLIMDFDGDNQNALDIAEKMRDDNVKHIPILAISADESLRDIVLGGGCTSFVSKPFKVREFEMIVRQLLDKS